jgi:flagellar motility protein MotE (MotC chaperone)
VIEVDPARRVKLRIEYERLAEMHPSDLAEILEDLAPAEREAVFTSLDEEVAAETLEEVEPKLQKALLEKLDEERIADIVEEMDPGAAADLLAELPEEQSDAILEEMEPEERHEVEELLEFDENSAAGCMTTDFITLGNAVHGGPGGAGAAQLRRRPGERDRGLPAGREAGAARGHLAGAAGDGAAGDAAGGAGRAARALLPGRSDQNDLAELFDKYNLHALPVVDAQGRMVGVVQADHVISFLREKLLGPCARPKTHSARETANGISDGPAKILTKTAHFCSFLQLMCEKVVAFNRTCERIQRWSSFPKSSRAAWAWASPTGAWPSGVQTWPARSGLRHGARPAVCAPACRWRRGRPHEAGVDAFPFPEMARRIWQEYFVPGGKPETAPYPNVPMHQRNSPRKLVELCMVSNFVEVFLAKTATRIRSESIFLKRCRCRTWRRSTAPCWPEWAMC